MPNGRSHKIGFEKRVRLGSATDEVSPRGDLARCEIRDGDEASTQAHATLDAPPPAMPSSVSRDAKTSA